MEFDLDRLAIKQLPSWP